jgi:hypothetical protein
VNKLAMVMEPSLSSATLLKAETFGNRGPGKLSSSAVAQLRAACHGRGFSCQESVVSQARMAQAARKGNRSPSAAARVGLRLGGSDDVSGLSRSAT